MASLHRRKGGETIRDRNGLPRVRYRQRRGGDDLFDVLPGEDYLAEYDAYEKRCLTQGTVPAAPSERFAVEIAQKLNLPTPTPIRPVTGVAVDPRCITLGNYLGTADKPGLFFEQRIRGISDTQFDFYMQLRRSPALAQALRLPLNKITAQHLRLFTDGERSCVACLERVPKGEPPIAVAHVSSSFDGDPCIDEHGESTHQTRLTANTYKKHMVTLRAVFNAAVEQELIGKNPMPATGLLMDGIEFKPPTDQNRVALNLGQMMRLDAVAPDGLGPLVPTAVWSMSRPNELTGMGLATFKWVRDHQGRQVAGELTISKFRKRRRRGPYVNRTKGKTAPSERKVIMPLHVAMRIAAHVEARRATKHPTCRACHPDNAALTGPMEHRGCGMAPGAPMWAEPDGRPLDPGWFTLRIWPLMREAAGLGTDDIGFNLWLSHLRSTGATQHLAAGTDMPQVSKMGGWAQMSTLEGHYVKFNDEHGAQAARRVDRMVAGADLAELPDDVDLDEPVMLDAVPDDLERVSWPRHGHASTFDDIHRVLAAIETYPSRMAILQQGLGLAAASSNYRRLARFATEHNVALPDTWATLRKPRPQTVPDEEAHKGRASAQHPVVAPT